MYMHALISTILSWTFYDYILKSLVIRITTKLKYIFIFQTYLANLGDLISASLLLLGVLGLPWRWLEFPSSAERKRVYHAISHLRDHLLFLECEMLEKKIGTQPQRNKDNVRGALSSDLYMFFLPRLLPQLGCCIDSWWPSLAIGNPKWLRRPQ